METETKITINGTEYVKADSIQNNTYTQVDGLDYVIIRTYSAGVHAGFLHSREGKEVTLVNTRRLWYWDGAFTLSAIAKEGVTKPENCKFSEEIDEIILTEAIEIIKTTDRARDQLRDIQAHEPE